MRFLLEFPAAAAVIVLVISFVGLLIGKVVTSSLIAFAQALRRARTEQTCPCEKRASEAGFGMVVRTSVADRADGPSVGWYAGPRRRFSLVALFTAAVLALALSASAQSHTYTPALNPNYPDTLTVSPTQGPPGTQVTLTGTGWDPRVLSNGGPASSGLPVIYEAPRPTSSGLAGTGACSPQCYGKQVASTSTGSPGCDPCDFTVTTTVPSDAPLGPGAFQVGTAAGPVGQEADFTVTQPTASSLSSAPKPSAPKPSAPKPSATNPGSTNPHRGHAHKRGHKHGHGHAAYPRGDVQRR
jgi:hypothetical protein